VLSPGDRIGDWTIDAPLGEGGMGAVYRVHSTLSERVEAALKVMKPSAEANARALFVREAEALAALRHPSIVRVMGFAEDPARNLLYLVMELARGETLRERMQRGPMDLTEALRTFLPLAHALEHAHAAGISHRDLKPSNVVLTHDGVRLVDFGIAAAAHEAPGGSAGLGTLAYLPPEVFRGEAARPRDIDVYAFGLLLHEALVGRRVFQVDPSLSAAGAAAAVGAQKRNQAPLDPGPAHPDKLREQVRRATDPHAGNRPEIAEICRALESLVERRGGSKAAAERMSIHAPRPPAVHADPTVRVPDPPEAVKRSVGATDPIVIPVRRRPPPLPPPRPSVPRGRTDRRSTSSWPLVAASIVIALVVIVVALAIAHDARQRSAPVRPRTAGAAVPRRASPRPRATMPAAVPSPAVDPSPIPSPVPSPVEVAATPAPAETTDAPAPAIPDVAGDWLVVNRIQATSYAPYRGLRLTYRLRLRQDGDTVVGEGEKAYEDGTAVPAEQRTPITVHGRIEGDSVVLDFIEEGAVRTSHGRFRWTVSDGRLEGRFSSDAAASRGISIALRER
jgi:serine/threonine protein kinase